MKPARVRSEEEETLGLANLGLLRSLAGPKRRSNLVGSKVSLLRPARGAEVRPADSEKGHTRYDRQVCAKHRLEAKAAAGRARKKQLAAASHLPEAPPQLVESPRFCRGLQRRESRSEFIEPSQLAESPRCRLAFPSAARVLPRWKCEARGLSNTTLCSPLYLTRLPGSPTQAHEHRGGERRDRFSRRREAAATPLLRTKPLRITAGPADASGSATGSAEGWTSGGAAFGRSTARCPDGYQGTSQGRLGQAPGECASCQAASSALVAGAGTAGGGGGGGNGGGRGVHRGSRSGGAGPARGGGRGRGRADQPSGGAAACAPRGSAPRCRGMSSCRGVPRSPPRPQRTGHC